MFKRLKQKWRELENGEPGRRFQEYYCRRQHAGRGWHRKPLVIAVGVLLLATGVFLLPAPGPGLLIIFLGASLIAEESCLAARALDATEVRVRRLAERAYCLWKRASPGFKGLIILLAVIVTGAGGWGAFALFFAS